MKKLLFGLLMLASASAHAIDFQVSREESSYVKYFLDGITASTSTILIDLSDTTNFPHEKTGYACLTNIRINVDKVAASTATIKIGVVTEVGATNGDVEWFFSKVFEADTVGTHLVENVNFAPAVIRAYVNSSGGTPYLLSSDRTTDSTVYQTDVGLPTTADTGGGVFPSAGDIVLRVEYETGASASDITVEALYYTKR